MDVHEIVTELEAERDRLDEAISALQNGTKRKYAHRKGRRMSAKSKQRISIMMKKRWAERKKGKRSKRKSEEGGKALSAAA